MSHPLVGVKVRRQLKGLKADQIADRLGLHILSYYRLERGERRCYLDRALTIAKMLDCTAEDLGREPTIDERVDLYRAGEQRRELLDHAGGDEALAEALKNWPAVDAPTSVGGESRLAGSVVSQQAQAQAQAPTADQELAQLCAEWSQDDEDEAE